MVWIFEAISVWVTVTAGNWTPLPGQEGLQHAADRYNKRVSAPSCRGLLHGRGAYPCALGQSVCRIYDPPLQGAEGPSGPAAGQCEVSVEIRGQGVNQASSVQATPRSLPCPPLLPASPLPGTIKMSEETKPRKEHQLITLSSLILILFFSLGCFLFFNILIR